MTQPALQAPTVASASCSLRVEALTKRFMGSAEPIFRDVSFSVPSGQSVALIGANGAGKSTLLRCCVRLIQPDSGRVTLDGVALETKTSRTELRQARRHCGFVFQKHCLVPRLTVLSNVLHGNLAHHRGPRHWFHGMASQVDRERAIACLEEVGLAHLAQQRCDQLSGGQSQRVAIARTLMQSPRMLFADEPTASLDPQSGEAIMELFSRLQQTRGLTLVFVSHHLEHALQYADRILGLKNRELLLDAPSHRESTQSLREFYG